MGWRIGFKGPRGDTGAAGAKGDTGNTGEQGVQGEQGIQGIQGVQGEQGETGIGEIIDRGDNNGFDFGVGDFTKNGSFHTLDLSAIVPANTKMVYMRVDVASDNTAANGYFRKLGNSYVQNAARLTTPVVSVTFTYHVWVFCDVDRNVEYNFSAVTWSEISLIICGWMLAG